MKNYLIYVISGIVLSLLLIFVLIVPAYKDFDKLNNKVFEKQATLQSQKEYFEELQNTADRLEKKKDAFQKMDSAIPGKKDLSNLMNFFQKSASKGGVTIQNVSPAMVASTRNKKIHAGKLNLTLLGEYPDFKKFLSVVEKSSRLIEIENISFQSTQVTEKEEKNMFTFNISTKFYYR